MGKYIWRRPFGIPRRKWKDYINVDLRKMGDEDDRSAELDQYRGKWLSLSLAVILGD